MSKGNDAFNKTDKAALTAHPSEPDKLKDILSILDDQPQGATLSQTAVSAPDSEKVHQQTQQTCLDLERLLGDLKDRLDKTPQAPNFPEEAMGLFERGSALAQQGVYAQAIECWSRLREWFGPNEPLAESIRRLEGLNAEVDQVRRRLEQCRQDALSALNIPPDGETMIDGLCRQFEAETDELKRQQATLIDQLAQRRSSVETAFQKARFFLGRKQTASAIEQFEIIAGCLDSRCALRGRIEALRKHYADLLEAIQTVKGIRQEALPAEIVSPEDGRFVEDFAQRVAQDAQTLSSALKKYQRQVYRLKNSPAGWFLMLTLFTLGGAVGAAFVLGTVPEKGLRDRGENPSKVSEEVRKQLQTSEFALKKANRMLEIVKADNKAKDRLIGQLTGGPAS